MNAWRWDPRVNWRAGASQVTSDKLGYASPAELSAQGQRQRRRVTPGAGDVREEADKAGSTDVLDTLFALHLESQCCTGPGSCVRAV